MTASSPPTVRSVEELLYPPRGFFKKEIELQDYYCLIVQGGTEGEMIEFSSQFVNGVHHLFGPKYSAGVKDERVNGSLPKDLVDLIRKKENFILIHSLTGVSTEEVSGMVYKFDMSMIKLDTSSERVRPSSSPPQVSSRVLPSSQ